MRVSSSKPAWNQSPADYLAGRPAVHTLPKTPLSRYVTMRDGCRLAVDVHLPDGDAATPRPALLLFTPYYRRFALAAGSTAEPNPNTGKFRDFFVPRGYAVVIIDVRGTGASFGTRDGFRSPAERLDSAEVADWVIGQPWSSGIVGATGISYLGAASDFLASTGHPAVKAIAPLFSVWDTYSDNYYPGGLQCASLTQTYDRLMFGLDQDRRDLLKEFKYYADPDFRGPQPVDEDEDGTLLAAALAEHAGNFRQTEFMADLRYREEGLPYDPAYSSAAFSPYTYAAGVKSDVAVLSVSGWMDGAGYANGAIARFLNLKDNPRHLLLGPWDHGARIDVSPWRADETPVFPWMAEVLRFFDTYLMGADTGLKDEAPIHFYALHEEAWHAADQWPPYGADLVLAGSESGALSATAVEGTRSYRVDPNLGTGHETRYERIAGHDSRNYYCDWQGRTARMLSWDSAPLLAPLDLAGHARLDLRFRLDAPDAALFVYLTEVEADGTERYVTEGLLRALHRAEATPPAGQATAWPWRTFRRADAQPVVPGEQMSVRIPLLPTGWQLKAGSQLRLSIAGADADHFGKVPHGRPPVITVDLAGTRLHLPARDIAGRLPTGTDDRAGAQLSEALGAIQAASGATVATALAYRGDRAVRIATSHAAFPVGAAKRFADAPAMAQMKAEGMPQLFDGAAALERMFGDWSAIAALGCDAVLNLPVRAGDGRLVGQINLLGPTGAFSGADLAVLTGLATAAAAAFTPLDTGAEAA